MSLQFGDGFLNTTPLVKFMKEKLDKFNILKLKTYAVINILLRELKYKPQTERKYLKYTI